MKAQQTFLSQLQHEIHGVEVGKLPFEQLFAGACDIWIFPALATCQKHQPRCAPQQYCTCSTWMSQGHNSMRQVRGAWLSGEDAQIADNAIP